MQEDSDASSPGFRLNRRTLVDYYIQEYHVEVGWPFAHQIDENVVFAFATSHEAEN
jgi:hypothetical protein